MDFSTYALAVANLRFAPRLEFLRVPFFLLQTPRCRSWPECGKKWAGTNLNRGYGHPKAEGYQATPPAHTR